LNIHVRLSTCGGPLGYVVTAGAQLFGDCIGQRNNLPVSFEHEHLLLRRSTFVHQHQFSTSHYPFVTAAAQASGITPERIK
jgi:hypothetical protein